MKKIVVLLLLLSTMTAIAEEENELLKWDTIAPKKYANAEYIENNTFDHKHPVLSYFSWFTIIGIPFSLVSINKSTAINTNNYWYNRRVNFESQRDLCKLMQDNDNQIACLMQLRQTELKITQDRNYAIQQQQMHQQQMAAQHQQMYLQQQQLNQLQNINNNVDDIHTKLYGY